MKPVTSPYTFSSIKQYLNILRIMHLEWDLPNPLAENDHLTSVMRGVRRSIGDQITQKLPLSPDILLRIFSYLDVSDIFDANVWAICLVLFHALLRKSSVLPTRVYPGHNYKVLSRGDVTFSPAGMCLNIRHTKTIQYGERSLTIAIPRLEGHVSCPVQATFRAFQMTPGVSSHQTAFAASASSYMPITGAQCDAKLRTCLSRADLDPTLYSAHSFRGAGATWMYRSGLPAEKIRAVGDWRSGSYLNTLLLTARTFIMQ